MGEIKFIGGLLLAVLFSVAIVSYVTNFGNDNNVAVNLNDDSDFTTLTSEIKSNSSQWESDSNTSSTTFYKSKLRSADPTTESGATVKLGFKSMYKAFVTIPRTASKKIFGGDEQFQVIPNAFMAFILFLGILYLYKTWIGRNPD